MQTEKAVHIVIVNSKDGGLETVLERKIPLVTIKSISMSNLRDDWMALNIGASEEGDPVISCYFKTELAANLLTLTRASITLHIAPTYEQPYFSLRLLMDILSQPRVYEEEGQEGSHQGRERRDCQER